MFIKNYTEMLISRFKKKYLKYFISKNNDFKLSPSFLKQVQQIDFDEYNKASPKKPTK